MPSVAHPSDKERKYDRQLRLWAASGQQALEQSRVLLVNSDGPAAGGAVSGSGSGNSGAGVVGVEALKNLILPGVGGYTIVDPGVVTQSDLGVNFFVEAASVGRSRAHETDQLLRELNPDVSGEAIERPISELLEDDSFLVPFSLVIACGPMQRPALKALSTAASARAIPLIYVHSVGFYSSFSIQLPELFPLIETHLAQDAIPDLRLTRPWPELAAAAAAVGNLETLDDHAHGHVPYLFILLRYLDAWRGDPAHGGLPPQTYREKTAFRSFVASGARTANSAGGEENWDEAVAAVLKNVGPVTPDLPLTLREVFARPECATPAAAMAADSSPNGGGNGSFWLIAYAMRQFHAAHGELPLPGSLPDMKAQSADYVALQQLYRNKARADAAEVAATVHAAEAEAEAAAGIGSSSHLPVPDTEIDTFCKNAAHIRLLHGRPLPILDADSASAHTRAAVRTGLAAADAAKAAADAGDDATAAFDTSWPVPIFIGMQTLDAIVTAGRPLDDPASYADALAEVMSVVQAADGNTEKSSTTATATATTSVPAIPAATSAATAELRRAAGGELASVSALAGGLVAQEVVKVLARQYVPAAGTVIVDGVRARIGVVDV